MTDDELTDAWEAGSVFPDGIGHLDHLRIAWVLYRRHPPDEARARLVNGTRRACDVHGCPEKFDVSLTDRWAQAIADAINRDDPHTTADQFLTAQAELRRGDLLGGSKR